MTIVWLHLYEISRIGKFIETESKNRDYQGLGGGEGIELLFSEVSLGMMKKSSGHG